MKKIFLTISVVLLSVAVGYCQNQPIQQPDKASSLTLAIKSDKPVYKTGEKIKLFLRFRNVSDERISICLYDIEHKLLEGLTLRNEGYPIEDGKFHTVTIAVPPTSYKLKDWTKRKLPIVTPEDFIFLEPQQKHDIGLEVETIIHKDSSWKYISEAVAGEYVWGGGLDKLPTGNYQIKATYENSILGLGDDGSPIHMHQDYYHSGVLVEMHNIWVGSLESNIIEIEIKSHAYSLPWSNKFPYPYKNDDSSLVNESYSGQWVKIPIEKWPGAVFKAKEVLKEWGQDPEKYEYEGKRYDYKISVSESSSFISVVFYPVGLEGLERHVEVRLRDCSEMPINSKKRKYFEVVAILPGA